MQFLNIYRRGIVSRTLEVHTIVSMQLHYEVVFGQPTKVGISSAPIIEELRNKLRREDELLKDIGMDATAFLDGDPYMVTVDDDINTDGGGILDEARVMMLHNIPIIRVSDGTRDGISVSLPEVVNGC